MGATTAPTTVGLTHLWYAAVMESYAGVRQLLRHRVKSYPRGTLYL